MKDQPDMRGKYQPVDLLKHLESETFTRKLTGSKLECDRNDVFDRNVGIRENQYYDVDALQDYVEAQKRLLINDQRLTYDIFMEHVRGRNGGLFFLMHQEAQEKYFYSI